VSGDRPGDPNVDVMCWYPHQGPGRGGEPVGNVWAGRGVENLSGVCGQGVCGQGGGAG
jgi:hypothetical protein